MDKDCIKVHQQTFHRESARAIHRNDQKIVIQINRPITTILFDLNCFRYDVCHYQPPYVAGNRRKRPSMPTMADTASSGFTPRSEPAGMINNTLQGQSDALG